MLKAIVIIPTTTMEEEEVMFAAATIYTHWLAKHNLPELCTVGHHTLLTLLS